MSSHSWHPEFVRALKKICGERSVLTDPTALLAYENDALSFHRSRPDCVVIPNNYEQLKQVVQLCKGQDFPFTLRGAGTSLSGGPVAVAGGLVIHVSKLRNILEVNVEDQYCVVEPGVVLNRLNQHLSQFGLFYPPDPSSSGTCTIGGNVAENSGGLRCFRYGVTANYVLGLEMILPTGEVVQFGGPARLRLAQFDDRFRRHLGRDRQSVAAPQTLAGENLDLSRDLRQYARCHAHHC